MTNYVKSTNFAVKDTLQSGDPNKIISGAEIDTEFNSISSSVSTKSDRAAQPILDNVATLTSVGGPKNSGRALGNEDDNIPVNNGILNVNLNAEFLNGEDADFYNDVPDNTRMIFYQAAAPLGWLQVTTINDRLLRVSSAIGGTLGGDWEITGMVAIGHALTVAEMPVHDHAMQTAGEHKHTGTTTGAGAHNHLSGMTVRGPSDVGGQNPPYGFVSSDDNSYENHKNYPGDVMPYTSNDGAHTHNFTTNDMGGHIHQLQDAGGGAPHSHDCAHNGAWRPAYADVIICERNK